MEVLHNSCAIIIDSRTLANQKDSIGIVALNGDCDEFPQDFWITSPASTQIDVSAATTLFDSVSPRDSSNSTFSDYSSASTCTTSFLSPPPSSFMAAPISPFREAAAFVPTFSFPTRTLFRAGNEEDETFRMVLNSAFDLLQVPQQQLHIHDQSPSSTTCTTMSASTSKGKRYKKIKPTLSHLSISSESKGQPPQLPLSVDSTSNPIINQLSSAPLLSPISDCEKSGCEGRNDWDVLDEVKDNVDFGSGGYGDEVILSEDGNSGHLICTQPDCGKRFTKTFNLNSHLRSHRSSDRNFGCSKCTLTFRRSHDLRRHFRSIHTVVKPYTCDICTKSFARTDALKRHINRVGSKCWKALNETSKD